MIVSASYKTDIPKFYGQWFMDKLAKGYCSLKNPYSGIEYRVNLDAADAFVFWTKDIGPFLDNLKDINRPFMVQYSINNYPQLLEKNVVAKNDAVEHMKFLFKEFGENAAVWRYDPIIDSSLTSYDWHIDNFKFLAADLKGTCNEVIISFLQLYNKTKQSLDNLFLEADFTWNDPTATAKKELAFKLADIAAQHGMKLSVCGQREFLDKGIFDAKCIDAERLSKIAGREIKAEKKGHREGCGCYESKDIGAYDTCPHGCAYCYAVNSGKKAVENYNNHDYRNDFLI